MFLNIFKYFKSFIDNIRATYRSFVCIIKMDLFHHVVLINSWLIS